MKIFKYILPMLLAGFMSGCGLLDLTSPNDIDADLAFTDATSVENALVGIYASMQSRNYYGGHYPLLADALTDDITTGGYDVFSLDELNAINPTSANVFLAATWTDIYRTIANCNRLLEGMTQVSDLDPDRAKVIEGEARTIRALAHFDLLRYFGYHWDMGSSNGIPIANKVLRFDEVIGRSNVAETYDFIISELTACLDLVDGEARDAAYVNSAVVNGLLARAYLYKGDKAQAAAHATVVIDDAAFGLFDAASTANIYNERRTPESIFELAFDTRNRSSFNGLTYGRPDAERPELFFIGDVALGDFFATRENDSRSALANFNPDDNPGMTPDGRTEKYRGEATKDNPAYILRLAELYLIRAEANGLGGAGLDDLNTLRAARGMASATAATDEEFMTALMDERRAELNFEGHRYFDLSRSGRFVAELGIDPSEDYKRALPIPIQEITATGNVIKQNPGY